MIVEVFGGGDILSPVEVKKTKKKKTPQNLSGEGKLYLKWNMLISRVG